MIEDHHIGVVRLQRHADFLDLALAGKQGRIRPLSLADYHVAHIDTGPFDQLDAFLDAFGKIRLAKIQTHNNCGITKIRTV